MKWGGDDQTAAFIGSVIHENYSSAIASQDEVLPVLLAEAEVDAGFVAFAEDA